ncbi:MAG: YdiY family protein [Gammaproteobacteria bacterium]
MNVANRLLGGLLLFALTTQVILADEITLTSGDRLLGSVQEINDQHIVIDTAFAKALKIQHDMVETLTTDEPIHIVFEDGVSQLGQLSKSKDSPFSVIGEETSVTFGVDELAANQSNTVEQPEQSKIKYSGNLDIGLSRSSGNEDDEDYQGRLYAQARTLKNRYTIELAKTIEKNDGDKTQDETFGSLQLDHFINEKWYGFGSVSFEEDFEELLNLRSTYSLGSGYQFYERDDLAMKGEIGFAYVDEDFEGDEDNDYAGGRWAYDYEQKLFPWVGAFHSHEGFFSLENSDDINVRSSTGFKLPLNDYINAKLQANIDWNKSPAEGAATTDKEYIFTLGYEF